MLSVRPKVAQLAFQVFNRPLHPELFVIHKQRVISRQQYDVRVDINNCGHVITFTEKLENGKTATICELATSATQTLTSTRCVLEQALRGSRTETVTTNGGQKYRTHFQLESVEPKMFWMVGQQLSAQPTEGLLHQFDASGRMALGALSYVNVETRLKSVLVQAIHTFPDDYAIVKVESLFQVPDADTAQSGT